MAASETLAPSTDSARCGDNDFDNLDRSEATSSAETNQQSTLQRSKSPFQPGWSTEKLV